MTRQGAATRAEDDAGAPGWLVSLSYHEAAHAVICFVLYGEQVIRRVELCPGAQPDGRTTTYSRLPIPIVCRPAVGTPRRGHPAPVSAEAIVDAHGVLRYAGLAAEELLALRRPEGGESAQGSSSEHAQALREREARVRIDREALAKLASTVGASRPAEQLYAEYLQEATRLLRVHWQAVAALAEALQEARALNGDRVDALLRPLCGS